MGIRSLFMAIIAVFTFGSSAAASTILHGTQLSFHHEFLGNQLFPEDFSVGPGVEITVAPFYTVDIEDDQLTLDLGPYYFTQNNGFNGIVIRDLLDNAPSFLSASVVSNTFANSPTFSITEDEIRIDFSTTGTTPNGTAVIQFEIAPIPLASSFAFLATGIGGIVAMRRRKTTMA